jgi:hypothetical protein
MAVRLGIEVKYYLYSHQHKGRAYAKALQRCGFIPDEQNADVVLVDRDLFMHSGQTPRYQVLEQMQRGAKVVIYPHSALPPWWYDGLVKLNNYIDCVLVIGKGQKEIMNIISPEARCEVVGWTWCGQKPYRRAEEIKVINFAPIHPSGGILRPEALRANREIFKELKRIQRKHDARVIVRYIGKLELQGLKMYPNFEWVKGEPDGSTAQIDEADVVIAEGTYMYMSVASGKPTVGVNQHLPIRANKDSARYTPKHWHLYGGKLAYPINYQQGQLWDLIRQANSGECLEWRANFIGKQLQPKQFGALIEEIAHADR